MIGLPIVDGAVVLGETLDLIDRPGPCLAWMTRGPAEFLCVLVDGHEGQHRDRFDRHRWDQGEWTSPRCEMV